jgi:hypothetical protein
MPDITYAMVPTVPLPADQATAVKNLLTNLVTFSHAGGSLALPSGYAPLSDALYQTAMTDITNDVVAQPSTPSTTTSSTSPTTTAASSGSSSGGGSGGSSSSDTGGGSSSSTGGSSDDLGALPLSTTTPSGSSGSSGTGSSDNGSALASTAAPTGFLLVSLDEAARYLLPAIVLLAIACLIGGPLLLFAPALKRRRRSAGGRS